MLTENGLARHHLTSVPAVRRDPEMSLISSSASHMRCYKRPRLPFQLFLVLLTILHLLSQSQSSAPKKTISPFLFLTQCNTQTKSKIQYCLLQLPLWTWALQFQLLIWPTKVQNSPCFPQGKKKPLHVLRKLLIKSSLKKAIKAFLLSL